MKRILVFNAGGSPSTNFIRSLREAKEEFYIVGVDCNKYYLMRSEANISYLIPEFTDNDYYKIINRIIEYQKIDFIHIQNDFELQNFVNNIDRFKKVKMFIPSTETINICLDKYQTYNKWKKAGIPQPKTMMINNEKDLKQALSSFGKIWIRDITGAGGRGSLPTDDFKVAKSWLDFKNGWGKYTAAECLKEQSITWMSIWKDGKLKVAQGRKRLYWELSKVSPSGISGATGTGITVSDPKVDNIAIKAIKAVDKKPHGIYSVDMTYDKNNVPNPTEINIGRFFTTHEFFTRCGLNMPYIYIKLAFNEKVELPKKKINPLPENLAWIRGIDFLPILTKVNHIEESVKLLNEMRK